MPDAPAASPAPASAAPAQQAAPTATTGALPASAPAATTTTTTQPTQTPATTPAPGDQTKDGAKPPEAKAPETTGEQPKPYELKLPTDAAIDTAIVSELATLAQKAGISQEHAQAVAEFINDKASAFVAQVKAAQLQAHQNQVLAWDQALRADKEIGGEKIQQHLDLGRRALERFASPEAIQFLRDSGLNSHPELARIFVRIGKAMGEDRIATGNGAGGKSDEQLLFERYPSMRKNA